MAPFGKVLPEPNLTRPACALTRDYDVEDHHNVVSLSPVPACVPVHDNTRNKACQTWQTAQAAKTLHIKTRGPEGH